MLEPSLSQALFIVLAITIISMYLVLVIFTYITLKEPMTSTDIEYKELYKVRFISCLLIPFVVYYHTTRFIFMYGSIGYCFRKLLLFYFLSYPTGLSIIYVIPKVAVIKYNSQGLDIEDLRHEIFKNYILEIVKVEKRQ